MNWQAFGLVFFGLIGVLCLVVGAIELGTRIQDRFGGMWGFGTTMLILIAAIAAVIGWSAAQ